MTLLLLTLFSASLTLYPRYDGVLLEVSNPVGRNSSEHNIAVSGYSLSVTLGEPVDCVPQRLPMWLKSLDCDSTGFRAVLDSSIVSVDYGFNGDSTVLLLFARTLNPATMPGLSWYGPPPMPDTTRVPVDSLVFVAMEQGLVSPWLSSFDTVVLDPGHGGRDPGAVGPAGTYEKHRTLEIALMVRDLLRIRLPEVRVIMTRTTDEYVSLGARTRLANQSRADLFVSIHCNASTNREATGMETFFLSRARTSDARAVELLENQVVEFDDEPAMPRDPLSFILADMAQNMFLSNSSALAALIQERLARAFPETRNRGVKQAGFYVLRGAYMPSVLVEVGFISNPLEEQRLLSLDFRFRAAQAIVDAIVTYAEGVNQ
jgi:N-acetylmuramoyl-L-alanine amidase